MGDTGIMHLLAVLSMQCDYPVNACQIGQQVNVQASSLV